MPRRRLALLLLVSSIVTLGALSCGGSDGGSPTTPTDNTASKPAQVVVSPGSDTLNWIGATRQLGASVLNSTGGTLSVTVTWSSTATNVASVSAAGLVSAVGVGTTSIVAQAGTVSGTATIVVRQVPATITKVSGDSQTGTVGEVLGSPLIIEVKDQGGAVAAGAKLTWSITQGGGRLESASTETNASGKGQASWRLGSTVGGQALQVSAGSLSPVTFNGVGTQAPGAAVTITGVIPALLIEGQAATLQGTGFSSTPSLNVVKVDGFSATVTSSSNTELKIVVPTSDCRPSRRGTVSVDVGSSSASITALMTPAKVWDLLEPGYAVWGTQCVHLNGGSASEQYLVGIYSLSETPSSLTPATLAARTGVPALQAEREAGRVAFEFISSPSPTASGTKTGVEPEPSQELRVAHRRAEAEWRERERLILAPLIPRLRTSRPPPTPHMVAQPAAAGDTVTLNVPPEAGTCSDVVPVKTVVRYVGSGAIWLEDVGNPTVSFTTAEYQALDQQYSQYTHQVLVDYFGGFRDLDGNGRSLILLTKEVNRRKNLLGFVSGADVVPREYCARSNEAEIFYGIVPDPAGVVGEVVSKSAALDLYPSLMAHEITHIAQFTRLIWDGAAEKKTWELEGSATLAEQLVGFRLNGHSPNKDLGYSAWNSGGRWYYYWVSDLVDYFGYSASGHVANAPEQCSWVGTEAEGNTGPCSRLRAPYGVPSTLLRMVLDRWGPGFSGGEAALMRQLTASSNAGLDNIAAATGQRKDWILSLFGMTIWGDGRLFDSLGSWNIYDIFSHFSPAAQLQPYSYSGASPSLTVSVRAGSQAFLSWTPPGGHAPTSLRITTPSGAALPSTMGMWVLRTR